MDDFKSIAEVFFRAIYRICEKEGITIAACDFPPKGAEEIAREVENKYKMGKTIKLIMAGKKQEQQPSTTKPKDTKKSPKGTVMKVRPQKKIVNKK